VPPAHLGALLRHGRVERHRDGPDKLALVANQLAETFYQPAMSIVA
jgi:hypothetical protein